MTGHLPAAVAAVRGRLGHRAPNIAIVLGSGLGGLAERLTDAVRIPYADIPGFHVPTVEGHRGELVAGMLAGRSVLAQSGRFHLYEGHDAALAGRCFELGWIARQRDTRAVAITQSGHRGFAEVFGIALAAGP